jgi:hypothetical protein
MSGYRQVLKFRDLEREVDELGFMMANPKHGYSSTFGDQVALIPKDQDSLPVYSRDAELFVGTLEELTVWLRGVEWARKYDHYLGVSDEKKRSRKEQDERNRQLVRILKEEKNKSVLK